MHVDRLSGPRGLHTSSLLRAGLRRIASSVFALGLVVGLAACGGGESAGMAMASGPVAVTVTTLERKPVTMTEELPGRTSAFKVAEIRPQVTGIVAQRLFEEGSTVKAGQQLYQIDDATYQAALERGKAELQRARAAAEVAKARLDRFTGLRKSQAVSQQDLDDAEAAYKQAEASIAAAQAAITTAEIDLRYTKVFAPISGRIGISQVTEGALVTANQEQPLTVVTQLDPIYVDMSQSSTEFLRLREQLAADNTPVRLQVKGLAQIYPHLGELKSSDVTVDQSTGAVRLRALFPNPDHRLLPGLFVQTQVGLGEREALLLPQRAATRQANGALQVWKVNPDQTVAAVEVTTTGAHGNDWLVTEGVEPGDVIVVEGYHKLAPGAQVQASPFRAPAAPFQDSGQQQAALTEGPALSAR